MIVDRSVTSELEGKLAPSLGPKFTPKSLLQPYSLLAGAAFSRFVAMCASPESYRTFLEQTLIYVSETVPTLRRVAAENPNHPLSRQLLWLAAEETGHDELIRQDISTLTTEPSGLPISPALTEYVQRARSIPQGNTGISLLCGDIVAMEGYPPTTTGITWLAKKFRVPINSWKALLEHAKADAVHGPVAFKRLEHPSVDPELAIERAIETLRLFTRHWNWLTQSCQKKT